MAEREQDKGSGPAEIIGGALNIFGLKIDLGELLRSPEELQGRLEELRATLKAAGGKEVLSDAEWREGRASISGHIRTRGLSGEQEFHVGTLGRARSGAGEGRRGRLPSTEPEVTEPPVDVFDEGQQVTIVADVPGVSLEDLELKVEGRIFSLATKATARRSYRKELRLEHEVDPESTQATCHNGALEVHIRKR